MSESGVAGLCNPATARAATTASLGRNGNTKGTQYLMGAFNYEIMPKLTLIATAGYTWVKHYNDLSYFDYKVGVTYDWAGWLLGASIIGTDADKQWWYATNRHRRRTARSGRSGLVLSVGKTF